jgi:hypothetical protein
MPEKVAIKIEGEELEKLRSEKIEESADLTAEKRRALRKSATRKSAMRWRKSRKQSLKK